MPLTPSKQIAGGGGGAALTPTSVPPLTNGAYTTTASDASKVLAVTTGASNAVITLGSAATAGDGAIQQITKADAGAGIVQVFDNSSQTYNQASAWLITQGDVVFFRSNGTAWAVYRYKIAPWRQVFNASTTTGCVVPPLFTSVDATVFSGGTGGGSGSRGATSVIRSGGSAGGIKQAIYRRLNACDVTTVANFGSAIPIVIGLGGMGAPPVTTDSTSGSVGGIGGYSYFGTLLDAYNGVAFGSTTAWCSSGGSGVSSGANNTTAIAGNNGGIPSEIGAAGYGSGGVGTSLTQTQAGYGSGGTTSGAAPTSGTVGTARLTLGGSGGGGGAYITGQAGQTGGAGGFPGGGGGGGSASDNGFASGGGGNGGGGQIRLTWNFGE